MRAWLAVVMLIALSACEHKLDERTRVLLRIEEERFQANMEEIRAWQREIGVEVAPPVIGSSGRLLRRDDGADGSGLAGGS